MSRKKAKRQRRGVKNKPREVAEKTISYKLQKSIDVNRQLEDAQGYKKQTEPHSKNTMKSELIKYPADIRKDIIKSLVLLVTILGLELVLYFLLR